MEEKKYMNEFDEDGYNKVTKIKYDLEGYDKDGFNIYGEDRDGYDRNGFDEQGIHKVTGTKYDEDGYDQCTFNIYGEDRNGFNEQGIHEVTGTEYDEDGYDCEGLNSDGFDREGYNSDGLDIDGYNKNGKGGVEIFEKLQTIKNIDMEEYIISKMPSPSALKDFFANPVIGDRIEVSNIFISNMKKYDEYIMPFNKESYLKDIEQLSIKYGKGDKLVSPKEEDIDKSIEYLKENDRMISKATVIKTVKDYLLGNIDITKTSNHNIEEVEKTISGRKLSDVNKASSEIVQANEEREQNKTTKEEHDEE